MPAELSVIHSENRPKTAENRAFIPGRHPWNTGGKKGRSGRKPNAAPIDLPTELQKKLADPRVIQAVETILTDPSHPQFAAVLKISLDRAYGKPHQTLSAEIDNKLEIVIRQAVLQPGRELG